MSDFNDGSQIEINIYGDQPLMNGGVQIDIINGPLSIRSWGKVVGYMTRSFIALMTMHDTATVPITIHVDVVEIDKSRLRLPEEVA